MAGTTDINGFTVPDGADNVSDLGDGVNEYAQTIDPYLVDGFLNTAARDAEINATIGNGHIGLSVYLQSEAMQTRLVGLGSPYEWQEVLPRRVYYQGVNTATARSGINPEGTGMPPAMSGTTFSRGANGPVVPENGLYLASLTVGFNSPPITNADTQEGHVQIGLNGPTVLASIPIVRGNFNVYTVTALKLMAAGDEFTGGLYQSSGASIGIVATWNVTRIGA